MNRSVFRFDRAIVRQPAPTVVDGLSSRGCNPDFERLAQEHRAYMAALEEAGVQLMVLPPLAEYPDSVFVEDAAFVLPGTAILLRPGAPSRAGEAKAIAPAIDSCFANPNRLESGMVDGGDILVLSDEIVVGLSARTNREGAEQFADWARSSGRNVRIVTTPPGSLHFKSGCSLIDERLILASPGAARPDLFDGYDIMLTADDEDHGANALRVNDRLLISAGAPRTASILESRGYSVIRLATAEIEKLDAGLSCMSLRW